MKFHMDFKLTELNIATIKEHQDLIKVDNQSMALRDILDNAHKYHQWLRLEILNSWNRLESLGVTLDNVHFVIPFVLGRNQETKSSMKVRKKVARMNKAGELTL